MAMVVTDSKWQRECETSQEALLSESDEENAPPSSKKPRAGPAVDAATMRTESFAGEMSMMLHPL